MWLTKAHTSQEAPASISGSSSLYDFWKKKITKKDFIIYFLYFFIDITLIIALLHLIMILMSDFPSV
ncbi:hypothetical protein [uncultured Fusobacterium sp.]|uniref:hypothetical protein n=1 Tax=uncultured Fusobacterium sp. TaxID=159267 RepID=UPI0027DBB472|nr:hypothetical protein [uncultured Fusobacterium sp.]